MQANETVPRTCSHCDKPLLGRSDQRFCNDTCRNTFNRQRRQEVKHNYNPEIPEIIRVIKRNYEILKGLPGIVNSDIQDFRPHDVLAEAGIDTRFYTSTFTDYEGKTWYCVFERCYFKGVDYALIKDIPEKGIV